MKKYEIYFNQYQPKSSYNQKEIAQECSWSLPVFNSRQELSCEYTDGDWSLVFFTLVPSSSSSSSIIPFIQQNGGLKISADVNGKKFVVTHGNVTLNIPFTDIQSSVGVVYDSTNKKLRGYCDFVKVAEVNCTTAVLPDNPFVFETEFGLVYSGCSYFYQKALDDEFFVGLSKFLFKNDNLSATLIENRIMTPDHPTAVARPAAAVWTFDNETGEWTFPDGFTGDPQCFNLNLGLIRNYIVEFEFLAEGGSTYPYVVSSKNNQTGYNNNSWGIIIYPTYAHVVWNEGGRNNINVNFRDGLWHKCRFQMDNVNNRSILTIDEHESVYNGSTNSRFDQFRIGNSVWDGNAGRFYGKVRNLRIETKMLREAQRHTIQISNIYQDPYYKQTHCLLHNAKQLAYYPPNVSGINNEVYDSSPYHNKFMWCYNFDVNPNTWGIGTIDKFTLEYWAMAYLYATPTTPWGHAIINNAIKNSRVPVHICIQHDKVGKTNDVYINGKFIQRFTNVGILDYTRMSNFFVSDYRITEGFRYSKDFTPTIFREY